jgi:hypothetical protein
VTKRQRTSWILALALVLLSCACASSNGHALPKGIPVRRASCASDRAAGWDALDQANRKLPKGEFEIVLQNLGSRTPPPRDLDELIEWDWLKWARMWVTISGAK